MKLRIAMLLRRIATRLDPLEAIFDRVIGDVRPYLPDPMKPEKRDGPRPAERRAV